jgi:hypothetical protein
MKRTLPVPALVCLLCQMGYARGSGDLRPALISPGGLPIFFSSQGPLGYTSLTRSQLPNDAMLMGEVRGQSCQYSLTIPLTISFRATSVSGALGNGGFERIFKEMQHQHPGLRGIYDAKIDLHQVVVLGIFGKLCTEITAKGFEEANRSGG